MCSQQLKLLYIIQILLCFLRREMDVLNYQLELLGRPVDILSCDCFAISSIIRLIVQQLSTIPRPYKVLITWHQILELYKQTLRVFTKKFANCLARLKYNIAVIIIIQLGQSCQIYLSNLQQRDDLLRRHKIFRLYYSILLYVPTRLISLIFTEGLYFPNTIEFS